MNLRTNAIRYSRRRAACGVRGRRRLDEHAVAGRASASGMPHDHGAADPSSSARKPQFILICDGSCGRIHRQCDRRRRLEHDLHQRVHDCILHIGRNHHPECGDRTTARMLFSRREQPGPKTIVAGPGNDFTITLNGAAAQFSWVAKHGVQPRRSRATNQHQPQNWAVADSSGVLITNAPTGNRNFLMAVRSRSPPSSSRA